MTDPNDFDELASAHLDGVTSPEEASRVEADPALQARVEELRAVRSALGWVPSVDAGRRDAAIAAALAAFAEDGAESDPAAPAPVTALSARRLSPATVRVLSAVAVVAILALLVPLLSGIDGGDDEASFESTGDALESAGDASTDGDDLLVPEESAATTTVPSGPDADADLGAYEDLDALADAVTTGPVDTRAVTPEYQLGDGAARLCGSPPATSTQAGTAVVAGERVVVWVGITPEGGQVLTVLRADDCEVIDEREL